MPIVESSFKPAWWCPSPHAQTVLPFLTKKYTKYKYIKEKVTLFDNDFVNIYWSFPKISNNNLVFILHGLGGSVRSSYIKSISKKLNSIGLSTVLMELRGCSNDMNLKERSYHASEINDLDYVIKFIISKYNYQQVHMLGYSLGGNILLKWLSNATIPSKISKAIAVSVPLEIHTVDKSLSKGFSRIYNWYILRNLKERLRLKLQYKQVNLDKNIFKYIRTIKEIDEIYTVPAHGFRSVKDYYDKSNVISDIQKIKINTLIIHAMDDPFISSINLLNKLQTPDNVLFEYSKFGGHMGFISDFYNNDTIYWLEDRISNFIV